MKSVASIESCTQVGYVIREISPVRTLYKQVSPEAAYEKAALLVDEGVGELVNGIAQTVGRAQPEGKVEAVARAITYNAIDEAGVRRHLG